MAHSLRPRASSSAPRQRPAAAAASARPRRTIVRSSTDDSQPSSPPIQFSPAFAQLLQQSLARQSRSTAERIGIPGLVLDESVDGDVNGGKSDDGTGRFIWGAGAALASYLYRSSDLLRDQLRDSHVLELGCGTAVVSIAAAAAGAKRVLATDLPSRLQAAQRNVAANGDAAAAVRVAALDWNEGEDGVRRVLAEEEEEEGFDLVLGADLTYEPAALAPLARTVAAAVRVGGRRRRGGGREGEGARSPPAVLLAHRPRSREVDALMMEAFAAEGLALVEEEEDAELTGLDGGDGGDGDGGDGEPLTLYRVVLA